MSEYFHSVRINEDRCRGCVNCIKRCPTEAIRIRNGKARILEYRCIDCGECIRRCPNHAKTAVTDSLDDLVKYKYNIALPAPTLYAQFPLEISIDKILNALIKLGFDAICEVALGAEAVSKAVSSYLFTTKKRPIISSSCPAVMRLIQVKFPELIDHIVPFEAPVEVAARIAVEEGAKRWNVSPSEIGTWFITPCPAKMTAIRQPIGEASSSVTGAIGISQLYAALIKQLDVELESDVGPKIILSRSSWKGIGWAITGGETTAAGIKNHLIVDEIHNASEVLEQVALGKLQDIEFIECFACSGGCIGGPLTVENRFVARHNMAERLKSMRIEANTLNDTLVERLKVKTSQTLEPKSILQLDNDIFEAMNKVEMMEKMLKKLPGLDCGSCGSPNCKALAEDIVQGIASETDCVFKLRERVRDLAEEMVDLAKKLPPSLEK